MKDQQIVDLTAKLASSEWHREELERALAAALAQQTDLKEQLSAMRKSTSWNLTKPLRGLKSAVIEPDFRRRVARHFIKAMIMAAPLPSSLKARVIRRAQRMRALSPLNPNAHNYAQWIERYDTLKPADVISVKRRIEELPHRPLISIVVPVYNTNEAHLNEMIHSVKEQIYPYWELCIADDASAKPHIQKLLEQHRRADSRIKVVYRETNGHISAASNSALELATGEYIALLDHDDVLPQHALSTVVEAIVSNPDAQIFYSDEDKIDQNGQRYDPYFKPDWNQELLYGQNYISHLGVYCTDLIKRIGGFRVGYEGSQDYDLALRATAATTGPIVHIPHVLYHWRLFQGAQTFSSTQLETATAAARRAIQDQLAQQGKRVTVTDADGRYHRVIREEPKVWPRISAIVPTRDHADVLRECVHGLLFKTDYPSLEVIIADNDSIESDTFELFEEIETQGGRIIKSPGAFNYSKINNAAARAATGDLLLLINNDISMIDTSWLKEMVGYLLNEDVAAVGAKLLYPDRTLQHGGVVLGMGGVAGHIHLGADLQNPGYFARLMLPQDISCVTAACMVVKKSVFEKIDGFDETNLAVAFNDVDLCIRIRRAGYRIIWTPHARLLHHESKSRGSDLEGQKRKRFVQEAGYMQHTWSHILAADPFYNPNLSLDSTSPRLSFPPRVNRPWSVPMRDPS